MADGRLSRQMVGSGCLHGRLVHGHDSAVRVGNKSSEVTAGVGGRGIGGVSIGGGVGSIGSTVGSQMVGPGRYDGRLVGRDNGSVRVGHQRGVVQGAVVDCSMVEHGSGGIGSGSSGVGGGSSAVRGNVAGIGGSVAGQMISPGGGYGGLVHGDDSAVGVRHQAVESAGSGSCHREGRHENLQIV